MRHISRRYVSTSLLVAVLVFTTACDSSILTAFRSGFAASKPFIQTLVDTNTIPQTAATLAIADVDDGIAALTTGDRCLKAITEEGSAKKLAKAKCYYAAAQSLRTILDRHHFESHETLNRISTIVSGAIAALEEYYRSVSGPIARSATVGKKSAEDAAEKVLKEKMEKAKKEMQDLKHDLER